MFGKRLIHPAECVFDLFLPKCCRVCGSRLLKHEHHVCQNCAIEFARTGYAEMSYNPMEQRFVGEKSVLIKSVSPYFYEKGGAVSHLIHTMKYGGVRSLGLWLGVTAANELSGAGWFSDMDFITPVPMHWLKKLHRGFNQSMEICRGVSEVTGLPVVECLRMPGRDRAQAHRKQSERWNGRRGVFELIKDKTELMQGKHILVVDDVCTTGSTLQSIVRILSSVPDLRVSLFTVAVTH